MSRKDTIIIAVLINASLLAFLFVMAMHTDEDVVIEQAEIAKMVESKPHLVREMDARNADEVDNMLKDLSMADLPQAVLVDEELAEAREVKKDDGKYVEVTVKRGDVLSKIAQANGTTVEAIKKVNHLVSEKLTIGQVLHVPVGVKRTNEKLEAIALLSKPEAGPEYYVIKSGDNPWKIAKQLHVKYDDLLNLNNLDEERARNLKIGDRIRIK